MYNSLVSRVEAYGGWRKVLVVLGTYVLLAAIGTAIGIGAARPDFFGQNPQEEVNPPASTSGFGSNGKDAIGKTMPTSVPTRTGPVGHWPTPTPSSTPASPIPPSETASPSAPASTVPPPGPLSSTPPPVVDPPTPSPSEPSGGGGPGGSEGEGDEDGGGEGTEVELPGDVSVTIG